MAQKSYSAGGPSFPSLPSSNASSRLYVGGLLAGTTESQLYNYFRKFGALHHVSIPQSVKRKSKLFGFVQFIAAGDAQLAMEGSRVVPFDDGTYICVNLAASEQMKAAPITKKPHFKVLLSAIPLGTDVGEVAQAASAFGQLLKISPYKTFNTSSFGCRLKFASLESAFEILKHRYLVLESGITIQVKPYYSQSDKNTGEVFTHLEQKYTLLSQFVHDNAELARKPVPIKRFLVLQDKFCESQHISSRNGQSGIDSSHKFVPQLANRSSIYLGQQDYYSAKPGNVRFNLKVRR